MGEFWCSGTEKEVTGYLVDALRARGITAVDTDRMRQWESTLIMVHDHIKEFDADWGRWYLKDVHDRMSEFLGPYLGGDIPEKYKCDMCGAFGCKMWRYYQTFLEKQKLFCAVCAGRNQDIDVSDMDEKGKIPSDVFKTVTIRIDQIGWLVPAIPTEDEQTYWGYTSVPYNGCRWWDKLPSKPEVKNGMEKTVTL